MFGQANRRAPTDPRIQSWYGLTLVLVEKNSNLGVVLVDGAVRNGAARSGADRQPVAGGHGAGQRVRAVRALERGLAFHPETPSSTAERLALGTRQRPVLSFLSGATG